MLIVIVGMDSISLAGSNVKIIRSGSNKISGLTWLSNQTIVSSSDLEPNIFIVNIAGTFLRQDWNLLWMTESNESTNQQHGEKIKVDESGKFYFKIHVQGISSTERLIAIGPKGQTEIESINIVINPVAMVAVKSRWLFNAGVNVSSIQYRESFMGSSYVFTEKALTAKGAVTFLLKPGCLDLSASFYATAVPLSMSLSEVTARFLGVNARVGYVTPFVSEPWRLSFMFGWYYTTMFVSPSVLGFRNMAGPQVFPVIRRAFSNGRSLLFYAKVSPVGASGLAFESFTNREVAGGSSYTWSIWNKRTMSATLDVSSLKLDVPRLDQLKVDSTSISLGLAVGW